MGEVMITGITGTILLQRKRGFVFLSICPRGLSEPTWDRRLTSKPARWLSCIYKMLAIPESSSEAREVSFREKDYKGRIVLSQPGSNYSMHVDVEGWGRMTTVDPTRGDLVEFAYLLEKLPSRPR